MKKAASKRAIKTNKRKPGPKAKPKSAPESSLHVLLRTRNELGVTFSAHAEILARSGSVFFGKMGRPIGPKLHEDLNAQIARGVTTYLYLTTRERWNGAYVTEALKLRQVHSKVAPEKLSLVPLYYVADAPNIQTWFEAVAMARLSRDEMNRIYVISSGREIMSVIKSTAAVFKVSVRAAPTL
jgi:hypothetical protein